MILFKALVHLILFGFEFNSIISFISKFDVSKTKLHYKNSFKSLKASLLNDINRDETLTGTILYKKNLKLLFKASRDGWTARAFHRKCDCGLPSLLLARISNNDNLFNQFFSKKKPNVVGGFNPFGWTSADDYRNTFNAFVFYADTSSGKTFKCKKRGGSEAAIYDFGTVGPSFGSEALIIPLSAKKMNIKGASSTLGNDYEYLRCPEGTFGSLFRRSGIVLLDEIEVYVDSEQDSTVRGDAGAGIDDDFSWGGYGT